MNNELSYFYDFPFNPELEAVKKIVILFHGFTSCKEYWNFHADYLKKKLPRGLVIIRVEAPMINAFISGGAPVHGFYEFYGNSLHMREDDIGINDNNEKVKRMIFKIMKETNVNSEDIFLMGFSQGGAVALYAGTTLDLDFGGVVVCSSYYPLLENPKLNYRDIPILYIHGSIDPVLPINLAHSSVQHLIKNNYEVIFHEIKDLIHVVRTDELEEYVIPTLKNWMFKQTNK